MAITVEEVKAAIKAVRKNTVLVEETLLAQQGMITHITLPFAEEDAVLEKRGAVRLSMVAEEGWNGYGTEWLLTKALCEELGLKD